MNSTQRFIAFLAIIVCSLMCVYTPWLHTYQDQGISQVKRPAGYHLVFLPPVPAQDHWYFGVRIDFGRLAIQLLGAGALFGGFYYLSRDNETA